MGDTAELLKQAEFMARTGASAMHVVELIRAHLAAGQASADGSISVDAAVAQVMLLFPGADRLALETLGRALGKSPHQSDRRARAIAEGEG